jgi:hypothetical protein
MPSYSFLQQDMICPICHKVAASSAAFQWGLCWPSSWLHTYKVGDAIRWHACPDATIIPWMYFRSSHNLTCNIGDPQYTNLIVFENYKYCPTDQDPMPQAMQCPNCHQDFAGTAVKILGGYIEKTWIYLPNDFEDGSCYYLLDAAGNVEQYKDEWCEHLMGSYDC